MTTKTFPVPPDGSSQRIFDLSRGSTWAELLDSGPNSTNDWLDVEKRLLSAVSMVEQIEYKFGQPGNHLRPYGKDKHCLIVALRKTIRCFTEHSRIPCEFSWENEHGLPETGHTNAALFHIIQEFLSHIGCQPRARNCRMHLTFGDSHNHLRFTAEAVEFSEAVLFAIFRLRKRVAQFKGKTAINIARNAGAIITMSLPVSRPDFGTTDQ